MDRTNEFMRIVELTNVPQRRTSSISFPYTQAFEIDTAIGKVLEDLNRALCGGQVYESFSLQQKADRVKEMIKEMKKTSTVEFKYRNEQESMLYVNIRGTLRMRVAKHLLKLAELVRRMDKKATAAEERRPMFERAPYTEQQSVTTMENETESEKVRERQKINMQISEIGQIMEEISLHVTLQEENFKRIDSLMETSDGLISESLNIVVKTWENISRTSPAVIKFFVFWMVLIMMIWLIKK